MSSKYDSTHDTLGGTLARDTNDVKCANEAEENR